MQFSEACERNKAPILAELRSALARATRVLEIGSGTGQHAVHFARGLPHLAWQPTDVPAQLAALAERVRREGTPNLLAPLALDVRDDAWPAGPFDAIFTANTLHILSWPDVEQLFRGIGRALGPGSVLCVYGPFRYRGAFTSDSNARFDAELRARNPASGIRDFEAVAALASAVRLSRVSDQSLPANNQFLVFENRAAANERHAP